MTNQTWELVQTIGLVVVVILLIAVLVTLRGSNRAGATPRGRDRGSEFARPDRDTIAAVVNPIHHQDLIFLRRTVNRVAAELGYSAPLWYETTERDPGYGQAKQAANEGAGLVLACGGDGTVRAVAEALVGTETTLGLVPSGTGNLLARNLDIPLNNTESALEIAIGGIAQRMDVGYLKIANRRADIPRAKENLFLVMAGFGYDALMMKDAESGLKQRFGWAAYVFSGAKNLIGRAHNVLISIDGGEPHATKARTVIIGNTGRLPGNLNLMPDAKPDDGVFDVVAMAWRGFAGLSAIAGEIVNPAVRPLRSLASIHRYKGAEVLVTCEASLPGQVDGDLLTEGHVISARVEAHSLRVQVRRSGAGS